MCKSTVNHVRHVNEVSRLINQKPYRLLSPLSISSKPWESIGIDFIGLLPLSKNNDGEFDLITIIIDLLTVMVHLMPSWITYNAREIAELVFAEVYNLHDLPKLIISNWDMLFTSVFWTYLNKLIDTNQCMSSTYHPQSDGPLNKQIGPLDKCCVQLLVQCNKTGCQNCLPLNLQLIFPGQKWLNIHPSWIQDIFPKCSYGMM